MQFDDQRSMSIFRKPIINYRKSNIGKQTSKIEQRKSKIYV